MPRKFLRILIEIINLARLFAGRRQPDCKPSPDMENEQDFYLSLILMRDHAEALKCKREAFKALKSFTGLQVAPKANWECHKWTRLEVDIRTNLFSKADRLISTEKLYQDLS